MFEKTKVHIAAFVAMFFWGISYIWSKVAFDYYTPLTTVFFRLLISTLVLILFSVMMKRSEKIQRQDYWLFLVSSLFNPFLYFIFESYGLQRVSASVSAFIIATIPLFTPFAAFKFFGERLGTINVIGLGISFAGVMLMLINFDMSMSASPSGVALLALAVASAVVYVIFLKKLSVNYNAVTIIKTQNLIGVFYFLPFFMLMDFPEVMDVTPSWTAVGSIVMLGVFASSLAFVLFTYVIAQIGVSRGNMYANLIPFFAAIAAYYVLDEEFTTLKIAGMTIVICGLILSEFKPKKQ